MQKKKKKGKHLNKNFRSTLINKKTSEFQTVTYKNLRMLCNLDMLVSKLEYFHFKNKCELALLIESQ